MYDDTAKVLPSASISAVRATAWVSKGQREAQPLLSLAGDAAVPAEVRAVAVTEPSEAPYGNFMLTWPESQGALQIIRHVPDGAFFLRLLAQVYEPVLRRQPHLRGLLRDGTRLELSFTNDVLQVQLRTVPSDYSMIRHHALMLFYGTLWFDAPARDQWFALYDALVDDVVAERAGPRSVAELAEVEGNAFADFERFADRSLEPAAATALLKDRRALAAVERYLTYAAVAIAALRRDYLARPLEQREQWHREQLGHGYSRPDYLVEQLRYVLSPKS
ncbi:MAG TPA: hypothetical protein VNW94_29795 [Streptosporangiaceae bacterium]|nr:hypothetical protein [Streptosporangiaceae bacterium]